MSSSRKHLSKNLDPSEDFLKEDELERVDDSSEIIKQDEYNKFFDNFKGTYF